MPRMKGCSYGSGRRRHRRMRGSGLMDWLKKGHDWLKSNKVISTIASGLGSIGVPGAGLVSKVANFAGYGRRRIKGGNAYSNLLRSGVMGLASLTRGGRRRRLRGGFLGISGH